MDPVTDRTTLDAFVDGALTPEEAARVVMQLADSPSSQAHVDATMETNALLAAAFGAPMDAPVPAPIRAAIERAAPRGRGPAGLGWRPLQRLGRRELSFGGVAAAAAVVLALWVWPQAPSGTSNTTGLAGPVAAGSSLYESLETRSSGVSVQGERGSEIAVLASYLDSQARPCREFEMLERDGSATTGIACRDAGPEWTVAFAASRPQQPPDTQPGDAAADRYVPAEGVADAAVSSALDALGAGAALSPATEADLIAGAWQR